MSRARAKWDRIGLLLGIPFEELESIQLDCQITERCLMACLNWWLNNGKNKTNAWLASVLKSLDEHELALDLYPHLESLNGNNHQVFHSKRKYSCQQQMYVSVLIALLAYISIFIWIIPYKHSLSLPYTKQELFGREDEIKLIIEYINDVDVEVVCVTLFGSPGVGKSSIARHIGHVMLQEGMDVHYIEVKINGS